MEKEKGKFLKIVCPKCKNVQIVFGKASTRVKCLNCNYMLLRPTGGKTRVKAPVRQILWK